jgi:hypothetical protein
LRVAAITCAAGVLATVPNDGGAQWGPRYLLVAVPALLLLAADTATAWWSARQTALTVALVALLLAGMAMTRAAYRGLRGSKQQYAQFVDGFELARGSVTTIVTDLWWLDQVAAATYPEARFLYVSSLPAGRAVADRLRAAGTRDFIYAASRSESPVFAAGPPWTPPCADPAPIATLPIRDVTLYTTGC